jgi:hypothetical protein
MTASTNTVATNADSLLNPNIFDSITTASISSSAIIVDLSMSAWSATKSDADAEAQVEQANHTHGKAGKFMKDLMADNKKYKAIKSHISATRARVNGLTMPWNNNGQRLLALAMMALFKTEFDDRERVFWELTDEFVADYANAVAASAFKLGALFKRADYPSESAVRAKFAFNYAFLPVPESGHFLVDLESTMRSELVEHFNHVSSQRVSDAMTSMWERMHGVVTKMVHKLTEQTRDGTPVNKRFHDSFLTNAEELVDVLRACNLTHDARLTQAANDLERVVLGMDLADLKRHKDARDTTRERLQAVLDKYSLSLPDAGADSSDGWD